MSELPGPDFEMTAKNLGISKEEFIRDWVGAILSKFMPTIVDDLLADKTLDTNKLSDLEYVWATVSQHSDVVEEMGAVVSIEKDLYQSAEEAIAAGRPAVALILIKSSIEHRLNFFFHDFLQRKGGFSSDQIKSLIQNDLLGKLDWLMQLVSHQTLPEKLVIDIRELVYYETDLIHHHYLRRGSSQANSSFLTQLHNIDYEALLALPDELEAALQQILETTFTGQKRAREIIDSMLGSR